MRPDELPGAVRQKAAIIGLTDVVLLVVDKRQLVLSPFPDDGPVVEVDGTDAGRCYRESTVVAVEDGDHVRYWFPVLDGTSRVGVLGGVARSDDPLVRSRGEQLAQLSAELLVSKSAYGDQIVNASRRRELTLAAEIRWSLVPPLTFLSPDVSIAGYLEPAYDLAGDTFDYAVNANTVHTAIFDAVGHGMEASRIANMALLTYRHARRRGLGLLETYAEMDRTVEETFERSAYATAQLAHLDLPDGAFRWINAGHPPPLLVRRDEAPRVLSGRPVPPAGLGEEVPEIHVEALRPGDVILFYSDGITEARSDDGTEFGTQRLMDLLATALDAGTSPPEVVRQIVHAAVDHQGGETVDDATVLLLGWRL